MPHPFLNRRAKTPLYPPALQDEARSQLEGYNPKSAHGFPQLLHYIHTRLGITDGDLAKLTGYHHNEVGKWKDQPPNALIREKVRDYALKRLTGT